jgi:SAM-dependent methyltransferase
VYEPLTPPTDPDRLRDQYADSAKLRIRIDTHARYSERPNDWRAWLLERVALAPGLLLLDAGAGPGTCHPMAAAAGVRIVSLDQQFGMAAEAREQARRDRLPVESLQADLQAIPFRDASFDRVMANHVLYHVPDQLAAHRELRRVTRPGGRVVMATAAGDQVARLIALHDQSAAELGLRPTEASGARFTLDHLGLVRQVFPEARVERREDAFLFPEAEPAIRYYASGMVNAVEGEAPRTALIDGVRRRIEAIIAREGVFRVPKDAGAFVADL